MTTESELLTADEAGTVAARTGRRIRDWCSTGGLPHLNKNGVYLILREHLLTFMAEQAAAGKLRLPGA